MGAPLLGEPLPVELMNTVWADRDGVYDALGDDLPQWLRDVSPRLGLSGEDRTVDEKLAVRFRELRDGLRRMAAAVTEDDRPPTASTTPDLSAAVEAVNRSCAYAPTWSELSWPPVREIRSSGTRAATALSVIAEQAVQLFTEDSANLRACHGPGCVLYFVRNHPRREWCSAGCGNRARVARHYRRHHAGS
jgi:predicted RNA-binding Zn ribbon-like protein